MKWSEVGDIRRVTRVVGKQILQGAVIPLVIYRQDTINVESS